MLPRIATRQKHHPVVRARLLPKHLIENNADVIVFQEAFDGWAMRIIKKQLKKIYPYNVGYKNKNGILYKRAGGVLMFSKYPIREVESIRDSACSGIDCSGRKGALLAEVDYPGQKFQVLGTHMQAGGTHEIKKSQYKEAGELLKRHQTDGIPQLASGDFNCHKNDTALYPYLVSCLDAADGDITGEFPFTTDHLLNDMTNYRPDKRSVIDYVFYRPNGVQPVEATRVVRVFREQWNKTCKDLSDHFGIELQLRW